MMVANGMGTGRRATWRSALRLLSVTLAALLLAWTCYLAANLSLGHISAVRYSDFEVDTGQLDVRPGTPGAAVVGYVAAHAAQFGWSTATKPLTIRVNLLGSAPGGVCFEVLAAHRLYVMTIAESATGHRVAGLAENFGPGRWRRIVGPDVVVCRG